MPTGGDLSQAEFLDFLIENQFRESGSRKEHPGKSWIICAGN